MEKEINVNKKRKTAKYTCMCVSMLAMYMYNAKVNGMYNYKHSLRSKNINNNYT